MLYDASAFLLIERRAFAACCFFAYKISEAGKYDRLNMIPAILSITLLVAIRPLFAPAKWSQR